MRGYDTAPDCGFLRALQNENWTVGRALAELVDNSFGSARGDASMVRIAWNRKERVLMITDNGRGMREVGDLFKLGAGVGLKIGDIGFFGFGGTKAIIWLSKQSDVWTLRDQKVQQDTVCWPPLIEACAPFPTIEDKWTKATKDNTPQRLATHGHGTYIQLYLRDQRRFHSSNVRDDLRQIFATGLRQGKTIIWKTDDEPEISLKAPNILANDSTQEVKGLVEIEHAGAILGAKFDIAVIPGLTESESHVDIGFGARLIKNTTECYSSADRKEVYLGNGVGGYIDLLDGWQPYLCSTKDGVDDAVAWRKLMAAVFELIRPILQRNEKQDEIKLEMDLKLTLVQMLNGQLRMDAPKDSATMPLGIEWGLPQGRKRKKHDRDGDKARVGKQPARSLLDVNLESDRVMGKLLCKAKLRDDTILILVNNDHPRVKEAIDRFRRRDPGQFIFLATREMAHAMVTDDVLLRRIFGEHRFAQIETRRNNGGGEEELVARFLVDCAPPVKRK